MSTLVHEQTINTSLGEVLGVLGKSWKIRSENIGPIFEEGGRPDILIEKADGYPIVLEAEVSNHRQAESEAKSRLGNRLVSSNAVVHAAVALVYPEELRNYHGGKLRNKLREISFEYVLYTVNADGPISRFPETGWISSNLYELAVLLHRSSIPVWRAEALTKELESGVVRAANIFSASHPNGSALGRKVANILNQSDDEKGQTRRMAMTVVIDALVFHAALSEAEMKVPTNPPRLVKSPSELRTQGKFRPTQLSDEWELVIKVNYWPIFQTAKDIIQVLPTSLVSSILDVLWETAERLIIEGVARSHDLTGVIFQRLIADRKFLATYYTRPAGAALLAGLAIPIKTPITGEDWGNSDSLATIRIGDFACGTGTLLSTAYQRIGLLHEIHGGDAKALHPVMMEHGLVGLDVLTVAVHLTAAMLAGMHPDTPFGGECLLTMPYGGYRGGGLYLGSLDLLQRQTAFDIIQEAAKSAGGRGAKEIRDLVERVDHGQFCLVIMNPPFLRHGSREGDRRGVHNPAFSAFGLRDDEKEQNRLARHLRSLSRGGCGHGHAGLASYFVDLADRKTAPSGTLALVLPLTALSGRSWEKVRFLLREKYSFPLIVTIAEKGSHSRSFSADTGMAELLFVGRKEQPESSSRRATFVVLERQPKDALEGEQIAQTISKVLLDGHVRRLEDGPFGGTRILLGETSAGEALDCPLPEKDTWPLVGVKDVTLAQTAHQIINGRLWVEGMPVETIVDIPVVPMSEMIQRIGPHHLDLTGTEIKADKLPQGPFKRILGVLSGTAYPCLWNHKASRERRLIVEPDSHCKVREIGGFIPNKLVKRAELRWATAARAHYNLDLGFGSHSLIVAMTESPTLGGRAWPTVIFDMPAHEYAFSMWSNSTLGLLCHWWMSNKSWAGRGTSTITSIPTFRTLDLRELTPAQHAAARDAFEAMSEKRLLPFCQIDEDPIRAELDKRLIVDVLKLPRDLCAAGGPMERLRIKLAGEPQIRGTKKSKIAFTKSGETSVPR